MRTSGILTIGGGFVALIGGAFTLLMLMAFLKGGHGFADLSGLFVGGLVLASGLALIGFGRKRSRIEEESDERNFSESVLGLAKKNGSVTVDQVCKVSGLSREEAQTRMRTLTGKGLFDMDFDDAGQMTWKLSPDAGRAQLAELAGRGG